MDSLDEIANLDGIDDVDTMIKCVTNPKGTVTTGEVTYRATSRSRGEPQALRLLLESYGKGSAQTRPKCNLASSRQLRSLK
jgi:hypothetical protein